MKKIYWKAYAKINLGLDILSKRPDGYHNLKTVMQTVLLHDTLFINQKKEPGISLSTNIPTLPADSSNLVYKAAQKFLEVSGINTGLTIELTKNIPIAAGLAGGSSDAAATLSALNYMFKAGLPMSVLEEIAASLGSDIPYCLHGGTCLAEGRGEIITPLNSMPRYNCVLVKPNFDVSTRMVYESLKLDSDAAHPDIDSMVTAISDERFSKAFDFSGNYLETVTESLHPEITKIKEELMANGAFISLMCGSGPTVFGLFEKRTAAENAYHRLLHSPLTKFVYYTRLCDLKR